MVDILRPKIKQGEQIIAKVGGYLPAEVKVVPYLIFSPVLKYRDLIHHLDTACIFRDIHIFRRSNMIAASTIYSLPDVGLITNHRVWVGLIALCVLNTGLAYFPPKK